MPYIVAARRHVINNWLQMIFVKAEGSNDFPALRPDAGPQDCGELNYALTMTCILNNRVQFGGLDRRLDEIGKAYLLALPMRYQRINDLVGACNCAALELERRRPQVKKFEVVTLHYLAAKLYREFGVGYEIQKITENGDIDFGESADRAMVQDKGKSK